MLRGFCSLCCVNLVMFVSLEVLDVLPPAQALQVWGGSGIVWRGACAGHARLGQGWDKCWLHKSLCETVPSCCWKADPGWGREELHNTGSGRISDILWEQGQLQVPARNLKLSTELCCLFPCQVKKLFVCFTCTSVFALGLLLCSCSCVFLQFGPHSEKAELCTAPGPPEQCCKPLITCKSATCAVVSWEVGVSGFQCHPN